MLEKKIFKIVSQVMEVSLEQVNEDSSPDTIEKWDSLQHMNLVLALEQEFKISFSDQEIVEMLNVKIIMETLKTKGLVS